MTSTPQKTDPNTLMVISDITYLYSNILHELGKQVISFWIEKYPETLYPRFKKKLITDGIMELILNNNSFQFKSKNYIQISETAMKTKMAPK